MNQPHTTYRSFFSRQNVMTQHRRNQLDAIQELIQKYAIPESEFIAVTERKAQEHRHKIEAIKREWGMNEYRAAISAYEYNLLVDVPE